MKVFSVFDSKAQAYLTPFFSPTNGTAMRAWDKAVNEKGCPFEQNPEDYTLFEVGQWDENRGVLMNLEAKVGMGCAIEVAQSRNPEETDMIMKTVGEMFERVTRLEEKAGAWMEQPQGLDRSKLRGIEGGE